MADAELEALRREKEEKLALIAEKRKQIEELKLKKAARASASAGDGNAPAAGGTPSSVEAILAEVLSGKEEAGDASGGQGVNLGKIAGGRGSQKLQTETSVASIAIEPAEANVYERSTQTDPTQDTGDTAKTEGKSASSMFKKLLNNTRQRTVAPGDPGENSMARRAISSKAANATLLDDRDQPDGPPKEMSAEEKERVLSNADFKMFLDRASLKVERALGQEVFLSSAHDFFGTESDDTAGDGVGDEKLKFVDDYVDDKWAPGRPITDVRFSSQEGRFFLASYSMRENPSLADPDGCALIWNLAMKNRPEVTFSCQSAVLTAHFHRFNPSLCFGGTYAGGIVLWDARAKTGPVQRTPLSAKGHAHPVQAMQQVGTQNATNLVSASNDGRLCVWSLAMLVHPQESIDLKNESKNRRELAVTSLAFPENETNVLYVGAEDGSICQVHIHGAKPGVTESYDGHDGPVTGIDLHPTGDAAQHGVERFTDLAVSCSFDWSVKLWSVKQFQSPVLSIDTFEDYVYAAQWHPLHPAVFATVDGEGHVDLWNLNKDLEGPICRCDSAKRLALNKCHWSPDGKQLVTGDSWGTLGIYMADRSITEPRKDAFQQFEEKVQKFEPLTGGRGDSGGFGHDSRFGIPSRTHAGF